MLKMKALGFGILLWAAAALAWAQTAPAITWNQIAPYLPPLVAAELAADGSVIEAVDLTLAGERGYLKTFQPAGPGRPAQIYSLEIMLRQVGATIQAQPVSRRDRPFAASSRYWPLGTVKPVRGDYVLVVPGHGSKNVYLPLRVLAWPPRPEGRSKRMRAFD